MCYYLYTYFIPTITFVLGLVSGPCISHLLASKRDKTQNKYNHQSKQLEQLYKPISIRILLFKLDNEIFVTNIQKLIKNKDEDQKILSTYEEFSTNIKTYLQRLEEIIMSNIALADDEDEKEILSFLKEFKNKSCIGILYNPPQTNENSTPKYEHKFGKLDIEQFENKIKSKILILTKEAKKNS